MELSFKVKNIIKNNNELFTEWIYNDICYLKRERQMNHVEYDENRLDIYIQILN